MRQRLELGSLAFVELVLEFNPVKSEVMQETFHHIHEHEHEECCLCENEECKEEQKD